MVNGELLVGLGNDGEGAGQTGCAVAPIRLSWQIDSSEFNDSLAHSLGLVLALSSEPRKSFPPVAQERWRRLSPRPGYS